MIPDNKKPQAVKVLGPHDIAGQLSSRDSHSKTHVTENNVVDVLNRGVSKKCRGSK